MKVYQATRNQDLTEGRGPEVTIGYYQTPGEAYQACRGRSVQGSDGRVVEVDVPWTESLAEAVEMLIRRDTVTVYDGRDWNPAFDPRINDPEWAEYQRLHAKFGDIATSRSTATGRR